MSKKKIKEVGVAITVVTVIVAIAYFRYPCIMVTEGQIHEYFPEYSKMNSKEKYALKQNLAFQMNVQAKETKYEMSDHQVRIYITLNLYMQKPSFIKQCLFSKGVVSKKYNN